MKLAICSDLHLEFVDIILKNDQSADILILGGDICVAQDITPRVMEFFQRVSMEFPQTLYVMGNHEHYGGNYPRTGEIIQDMLLSLNIQNIHLLDRSTFTLDNMLFIGGTLWTDFNRRDPTTIQAASTIMNDYRGVKNTDDKTSWKFLPHHALHEHEDMLNYVRLVLANRRAGDNHGRNVVVVGHHAPSFQSIALQYQRDKIMNGCFASDLSEFILDHPEIVLWTHGHTHDEFDYQIGDTRVVCNPRGYHGYEARANNFEIKYIDL
jgi:3',5'-cyclic AMP phosphodiesterase CpdA